MAVKTFTTGEVLTASDCNQFLNNGGLVYITQATISSGASSVTINNCFSAAYNSYEIVITGGGTNGGDYGINMRLGSTTTGYYFVGEYRNYANTVNNVINGSNTAQWEALGIASTNTLAAKVFVHNPYLAKNTFYSSTYVYNNTAGGMAQMGGYLNDSNSYTGCTFFMNASTFSGGTITIYGNRLG